MEFEWDEDKRQVNIAKHRIDFIEADKVFLNPHVGRDAKSAGAEIRYLAIGRVDGKHSVNTAAEMSGAGSCD